MAFDVTLNRGGFNYANDKTLENYRIFQQMYVGIENDRANLVTADQWLDDIVVAFGPDIDTFPVFSKLDGPMQRRLLDYGRAMMEKHVWNFLVLGPRAPTQFLIDQHQGGQFLRKPQREVDAILFQSELNHAQTRGEDPALLAIALTALGLPSTPTAVFKDHDATTVRAVLAFCRLYGSAYESIVNADDNELDYQNVATGSRLSAQSRHDGTFMRFMEFHSWMAEATYWHTSGSDLFDLITQTDVGSDALDATQAEALELFKLMRGIGQTGGNQNHMDMKKALFFAVLAGNGFVPNHVLILFGIAPEIRLRDRETGDVIPGRIYIRAKAPVQGAHPQRDTWVENGTSPFNTYELVMEVPVGFTPDHVQLDLLVPQPGPGVRWMNFSGPSAVDADTFTIVPTTDYAANTTQWRFDATKVAKWAAGENILGEFAVASGPTLAAIQRLDISLEAWLVEDTAVAQTVQYQPVSYRAKVGVQVPPTNIPTFAQRESGTTDN